MYGEERLKYGKKIGKKNNIHEIWQLSAIAHCQDANCGHFEHLILFIISLKYYYHESELNELSYVSSNSKLSLVLKLFWS